MSDTSEPMPFNFARGIIAGIVATLVTSFNFGILTTSENGFAFGFVMSAIITLPIGVIIGSVCYGLALRYAERNMVRRRRFWTLLLGGAGYFTFCLAVGLALSLGSLLSAAAFAVLFMPGWLFYWSEMDADCDVIRHSSTFA